MTVKETVSKLKVFPYKAFWPDGTKTECQGEEFERKCEEFADREAFVWTEDDWLYDEGTGRAYNFGITYMSVS